MTNFQSFKVRVNSLAESVLIQKELFKRGYTWSDGLDPKMIFNSPHNFLYTDDFGGIAYGESEDFFEEDISPEISVYDILSNFLKYKSKKVKIVTIKTKFKNSH